MTAKFKGLTDRQLAVVETMRMRLTEQKAMEYLNNPEFGFNMCLRTYYREKSRINKLKFKRLALIASSGFEDQHLERIDQLELIQKLMWDNYHACISPYQKVIILEKIANIQPYLSSYYDATKEVMSKKVDIGTRQESNIIPINPNREEGQPERPNEWV